MGLEPGASDQGEHALGLLPPLPKHRQQGLAQALDGVQDEVAQLVIGPVPELFAGVEFETLGGRATMRTLGGGTGRHRAGENRTDRG